MRDGKFPTKSFKFVEGCDTRPAGPSEKAVGEKQYAFNRNVLPRKSRGKFAIWLKVELRAEGKIKGLETTCSTEGHFKESCVANEQAALNAVTLDGNPQEDINGGPGALCDPNQRRHVEKKSKRVKDFAVRHLG